MSDEQQAEAVRRQAVEEAREEILAHLRAILEEFERPPQIYRYDKPTSPEEVHEALEAARQTPQTLYGMSINVEPPVYVPNPHAASIRRLSWLLALSPGERGFVGQIADALTEPRDPAAAFSGMAVFADWLEDHGRGDEAGTVRKMTPDDGDVVVYWVDGRRYYTDTYYKEFIDHSYHELVRATESIGRQTHVIIAAEGTAIERLSQEEMLRLGWVKRAEYEAALDPLRGCLAGTPEGDGNTARSFLARQTLALVERLKRENEQMRQELRSL